MSLSDALLLDPHPFDVWIAHRSDTAGSTALLIGSGTLNDPYDGSTQARFDHVMGTVLPTLAAGTKLRVHLGPCPSPGGTVIPYQTNGYADGVSGGWQALAGMSLAGSGVDVTVLQLVNGATSGKHYFIIGHPLTLSSAPNLVDFATVSDLTLDCNLSGASNSGASAFGAVRLFGNHVRVSRIKAIKWGTKASGTPCFAISVITGDRGAGLVGKGSVLTIDNPSPVECDLLMSGPLRLRYLANHCDETARAIVDC